MTNTKSITIKVSIKIVAESTDQLKQLKSNELNKLRESPTRDTVYNVIIQNMPITGRDLIKEMPSDAPSVSPTTEPSLEPTSSLSVKLSTSPSVDQTIFTSI